MKNKFVLGDIKTNLPIYFCFFWCYNLVMEKIKLVKGDITKLCVDAIVNAANSRLLGGGGVDGAIHHAAGKGLLNECKTLGGCNTGEAKITGGYDLPCKYVIHTVGPIFSKGKKGQDEQLSNCYKNSLLLADKYGIKTIAFSAISTGVYGYPICEACKIALDSIKQTLPLTNVQQVLLVCFNDEVFDGYMQAMEQND